MATKHHKISEFTKNGIFNKKGIFDANYLLPAWQNMNNFQHILHNLYLLYKYTNNSFKDSRLELPWQQLQEMPQKLWLYGKNIWQILRFAQGKMWNWNLSGWYEFSFDYIYFLFFLDGHISVFLILVSYVPFSQFIARCHVNQKEEIWPKMAKMWKDILAHSHIQ